MLNATARRGHHATDTHVSKVIKVCVPMYAAIPLLGTYSRELIVNA